MRTIQPRRTTRRDLNQLVTILLIALLWVSAGSVDASRRRRARRINAASGTINRKTSIIVMLADDLGHGDVEYLRSQYDPNNVKRLAGAMTPNINAMASASATARFLNFHSTSSVCSPTRATLLSGRHPDRDCVLGANADFDRPGQTYQDTWPFFPGMPSVARDARLAGYATAFFGKWHLGAMNTRSPGRMGFDTWIASTGNVPTYDTDCFQDEARCEATCDLKSGCFVAVTRPQKRCSSNASVKYCEVGHYRTPLNFSPGWSADLYTARSLSSPAASKGLPAITDWGKVEPVKLARRKMSSDVLVDAFETFIRAVPQQQAVFAYLWFHEPHHPFIASPDLFMDCANGKTCHDLDVPSPDSTRNKTTDYLGTIVALDTAIGRVRRLLREIGRADDTLLVFTSDNGPEPHDMDGAGSAFPLSGWKGGVQEGGHRVAGLIEWPARIKSNVVLADALASSLDLPVTFRDLFTEEDHELNLTQPNTLRDGVSLLPLIENPSNWTRPKPWGICYPIQPPSTTFCDTFAFIDPKTGWKLISKRLPRSQSYFQLSRGKQAQLLQLYDLRNDVQEKQNLIGQVKPEQLNQILVQAVNWISNITSSFNTNCGGTGRSGERRRAPWGKMIPSV